MLWNKYPELCLVISMIYMFVLGFGFGLFLKKIQKIKGDLFMKCYHVYDSSSDEFCFDVYADYATTTEYNQVVFMRDEHIYCVVSNAYYTEEEF